MNFFTIKSLLPGVTLVAMLSGCVIGNGTICGPQTPLAYCDRQAYQKLVHPTPTRDYWEMASATSDDRRKDWMDCGGNLGGEYGISEKEMNGKTGLEAARIKFDDMQVCMMKRGYHYTGPCQGEIASQHPGCKSGNR